MVTLVAAQNLITVFLGYELLSKPAVRALRHRDAPILRRWRRASSTLIVGSVGSATLLYGMAMIYGATGPPTSPASRARSGRATSCRTPCCSPGSR
jgi:NADH-quinone oxidoreductase subunit N